MAHTQTIKKQTKQHQRNHTNIKQYCQHTTYVYAHNMFKQYIYIYIYMYIRQTNTQTNKQPTKQNNNNYLIIT